MAAVNFIKMHGLGNDFIIIDSRTAPLQLTPEAIGKICDRHFGIGCDQLVLIENSKTADCFMRIYNSDGSESSSCGNASRCVAWLMHVEKNGRAGGEASHQPTKRRSIAEDSSPQQGASNNSITIETLAGALNCTIKKNKMVAVNMGKPGVEWEDIPLAKNIPTLYLPIKLGKLSEPVAVSMGNPHMVFFVDDIEKIILKDVGPKLEYDKLFPERANVGIAQVVSREEIILKVWERGSGETLACGTGACAALVAASRRGLTGKKAKVKLPGGTLLIEWKDDGHVIMTGAVAESFTGKFDSENF